MNDTPCTPGRRESVMLLRGDRDEELSRDHADMAAEHAPVYATSFDAAQAFWAAHDGCATAVTADTMPLAIVLRSRDCPPGVAVEQVVVRNQAHAWPGGAKPWFFSPTPSPLDGGTLVLQFFSGASEGKRDAR
jgi:poly(3-hydroxybutyrate) depolymerase